jgi:glutathione S-transferase
MHVITAFLLVLFNLSAILSFSRNFSGGRVINRSNLKMTVELFGSQGSRSPLINWYLHEINCDFRMAGPQSVNPHPFGQIPAIRDGETAVFESGAILMYLADKYGGLDSSEKRAAVSAW